MTSSNSTKKIRVLEITPTLEVGGAENIARYISTELNKQGFCVKVISLYRFNDQNISEDLDIVSLNKKKGIDMGIVSKLRKLFANFRPDILHNHHLYTLFYIIPANIFLRAKVVQTIHTDLKYYHHPFLWKLIFVLFRIQLVNFSPRINPSLQNLKNNINIQNGVDIDRYRTKRSQPNKTIINIGRLEYSKNQKYLLEVFKNIVEQDNKFKLIMIGIGRDKEKLLKQIKALRLEKNVNFINNKVDPLKYFRQSTYYISTSVYEGMPLIVIEAMASGLVVFATKAGSIEDIIQQGKSGFIISSSDAKETADFFLRTVKNEKKVSSISNSAIKRAKKYSIFETGKLYSKFFKELIND